MEKKKGEIYIVFDFGKGHPGNNQYREATAAEIESGRIPANVESVIRVDEDGTYERYSVDGLGR